MKSLAKKFLTAAVALSMTATMFVTTASASNVVAGDNYVENDFIHLYCSNKIRYGLKTTGGNPENPNDAALPYNIKNVRKYRRFCIDIRF